MNTAALKTIYTCFPNGKHKVLTMSYDDGRIYDRKLVEIFNKYGIRGTFHINAGYLGGDRRKRRIKYDEIKTLYEGHEVACHTYTHPTIERCPLDQVVRQVMADRKVLEAACGRPIRGLSYPNGSYSEDIKKLLPSCGIEYARTVDETQTFAMPTDYYQWDSTCHHRSHLMENARKFAALSKTQYLYLMYVWGHSYEFEDYDDWDLIEEFCSFIGGRDDIWYAANIEIVEYMNAAKRLKFSAKADMVYNPSAISIWIKVNEKIIEIKGGETVRI